MKSREPPDVPTIWRTTRYAVDLARPKVMGIVNVTPDSFSDGGRFLDPVAAVDRCRRLVDEGADLLDIGAESTRPGAAAVPLDDELKRVMPVLEAAMRLGVPVSVDTMKAGVMAAALAIGVDIVNDVNAFRTPGALECVATHPGCGVCAMHMRGDPRSMQKRTDYADVIAEVAEFLSQRAGALVDAGVSAERIVLDPGVGFGKGARHNLELLRRQRELLALGRPLLVGWSRKSTLGQITGRPADRREAASLAAMLASVAAGASVVRVHDVAATVDALKVWEAAGLLPAPPAAPLSAPTPDTAERRSP